MTKKMDNIMKLATGRIKPIKAWFTGKIKIKGPMKLLKLNIAFYYAGKIIREKMKAVKDKS